VRRRSLRSHVNLWFGAILLGTLGTVLLVLHFRIQSETEAQVVREMQYTQGVLDYLLRARGGTLEARARSLGDLPKINALLSTQDPLTVQDVAREYPELARSDFVMLTNADGLVLAHTTDRHSVGKRLSDQRNVAEALRGQTVVDIRVERADTIEESVPIVYQVASAPARAGGMLTGTVHLGFALGDSFFRGLGRVSGAQISLLIGDRIAASTLSPRQREQLASSLRARGWAAALRAGGPLPRSQVFSIDGQQHLALLLPAVSGDARPVVSYLIQKSFDDALLPYRNIQRWLLVIGLVGLLMGVVLSTGMARGIAEPILRVVDAAEALGRGDWAQRVPITTDDEVGVLARTFNAMATRLQSWDADLRAAVAERTAELNQAVVRLDEASGQIRRFNADASHELRTPLTIIRGEAEVALRSHRSVEEYERVLQSILEESEHMGRLVDQLLMLTRADSGELQIEKRRVALAELLQDLHQQAQVLAREKQIKVDCTVHGEPETWGDELRLRQLFLNLLDNAVKYTGARGRVNLEAASEGAQVVVHVRDTGIGIPPAALPHIFERFYRVDKARSREIGSSGLGLAICKWIVDAHDATIEVESAPGEGTCVTVRLPSAAGLSPPTMTKGGVSDQPNPNSDPGGAGARGVPDHAGLR
jgi:signal transduction histidine kinase